MQPRKRSRRSWILAALIAIFAGVMLWGYAHFIEPYQLGVTTIDLPVEEWHDSSLNLKIAVAADFHLRPTARDRKRLEQIVQCIAAQQPDVILLLGDFGSGHHQEGSMPPDEIAQGLTPLCSIAPVLAVTGNHDAYLGVWKIKAALEQAGVEILERRSVFLTVDGALVQLAGVPDASHLKIRWTDIPERERPDIPMIILTHSPDAVTSIPPGPTLILAGHTHGGQVCLPGGRALVSSTQLGTSYAYGDHTLERKRFIVTRGLGCSILPLRFCCPPEIMILQLRGSGRAGPSDDILDKSKA